MWKRETPATFEISSSVSGSARWLSICQSAFCAGFIDHGLPLKRGDDARFAASAFDSPCAHRARTATGRSLPHRGKNSSKVLLLTRFQSCILDAHSVRRLDNKKQPRPIWEDDNARPCLQGRQENRACSRHCNRTRDHCPRGEEIRS